MVVILLVADDFKHMPIAISDVERVGGEAANVGICVKLCIFKRVGCV